MRRQHMHGCVLAYPRLRPVPRLEVTVSWWRLMHDRAERHFAHRALAVQAGHRTACLGDVGGARRQVRRVVKRSRTRADGVPARLCRHELVQEKCGRTI